MSANDFGTSLVSKRLQKGGVCIRYRPISVGKDDCTRAGVKGIISFGKFHLHTTEIADILNQGGHFGGSAQVVVQYRQSNQNRKGLAEFCFVVHLGITDNMSRCTLIQQVLSFPARIACYKRIPW